MILGLASPGSMHARAQYMGRPFVTLPRTHTRCLARVGSRQRQRVRAGFMCSVMDALEPVQRQRRLLARSLQERVYIPRAAGCFIAERAAVGVIQRE